MTLTLITLLTGYLGIQQAYDWLTSQAEASQLENNPSVKTQKDFRLDD